MIILGSTSEVAQAFVEKALAAGEKFPKIYLVTSSRETTERFAQHIDVKFLQPSEIIELDLTQEINYSFFESVDSDLLFCATGYLGLGTEDGLYDDKNTEKIIDINYAKLVPVINYFAKKWKAKEVETSSRFPLWQEIEEDKAISSTEVQRQLLQPILS